MINFNRVKLILSKIKIAQCNYKKILELKVVLTDLTLLNILWKKGFIYGYGNLKNIVYIFLKYNFKGFGLLSSILFLKITITKKQLHTFILTDPHFNYLIITTKGLMFHSIDSSVKKLGGIIIARF